MNPIKVAIGGSRSLLPVLAPRLLMRFLMALPHGSVVLIRMAASGRLGPFEQDVDNLCDLLGITLEHCQPHPEETPGRAGVFRRDIEMIAKADLVVLFLAEADTESGYSGTFHLFEKALDDQRPVYAWRVREDGILERWGEWDPDNRYAHLFT